jgi:hypothetical protein
MSTCNMHEENQKYIQNFGWLENTMVETTWNKNIKIDLRELSCEDVEWIEMAQEQWWAFEFHKNKKFLEHLNSCSMADVRLYHEAK